MFISNTSRIDPREICESTMLFEDYGGKKKTENENDTILMYSVTLIIENLPLVTHILSNVTEGWLSVSRLR
jgi:hypothetical protein